jgi:hypothetical protein
LIRHMVVVRFGSAVSAEMRQGIYDDLAALSGHLEGIVGFRSFHNVSPEKAVVHGFNDGFWVDFSDAAARDAYLQDTVHQAIGARLVAAAEGGIDGILVCDVEME